VICLFSFDNFVFCFVLGVIVDLDIYSCFGWVWCFVWFEGLLNDYAFLLLLECWFVLFWVWLLG